MNTDTSNIQKIISEGFIDRSNKKNCHNESIIGNFYVPTDNSWNELLNEYHLNLEFHSRLIGKKFLIISDPYDYTIIEVGHTPFDRSFINVVSLRTGYIYRVLFKESNVKQNKDIHFKIEDYRKPVSGEDYYIFTLSSLKRYDGYVGPNNEKVLGKIGKIVSEPFIGIDDCKKKALFVKVNVNETIYKVIFYEQDLKDK